MAEQEAADRAWRLETDVAIEELADGLHAVAKAVELLAVALTAKVDSKRALGWVDDALTAARNVSGGTIDGEPDGP